MFILLLVYSLLDVQTAICMIKYIAYYFREQDEYYGLCQHLYFPAFSSKPSKVVVQTVPKGVEKWMTFMDDRCRRETLTQV